MLGDLLTPGWQSSSADKRLQAIAKMSASDAENQQVFEQLVSSDPEANVRAAALHKLTTPLQVFKVTQTHSDSVTRELAEKRYVDMIGAKSTLSEAEFRALISADPHSVLSVAQHCPHANLRAELILTLNEQQQATLLSDVEYTETRKQIAENLTSLDALELARKQLKGKDKTAEKIIKTKIDEIRAKQKQQEENQAATNQLCEKIEFIANHPEWRTEFKDRYQVYTQQWSALNFTPDESDQQRFITAQTKAATKVEQQVKEEQAAQGQNTLIEAFETLCHESAPLSAADLIDRKNILVSTLSDGLSDWTQHSTVVTPTQIVADRFLLAQRSIAALISFCDAAKPVISDTQPTHSALKAIDASLGELQWPGDYPALASRSEVETLVAKLKAHTADAKKAAQDNLDKLHKRINRLLGSTKRGNLNSAKRELAATVKAASHYTGKDRAKLDERLEQAADTIKKMGDWKDFATEPKYLELCDAMEALIKSKAKPDKLANKIKALQDRWKALGHSDSADQHWERFKAAADSAYEPCSIFFKQRRETQRSNLEKRAPLIDKMRALLHDTPWGEQPDYKQVEATLRDIANEWQKIKDVEHGPGQKQWQKLSKLRASIYQKLDVVYDANIELKNQLISQAQGLLESDITEESINKLQLFQTRWKQVGVTRRKQDQAAWKKFKKTTDAVYEKIQGLRQAKRTEEDKQLEGYRNVTRAIQRLAKEANEIAAADPQFEQLQRDYKELPALPRNLPEKLLDRLESDFRRACDTYNKARERMIEAGRNNDLDALAKKAELCGQLEQLGADASADKIAELEAAMADIQLADKNLQKRFETRLASARELDRSAAGEARQLLCIDLEILLGVDSPAEDKARRTQIQLERMKQQGIGHNQVKKGTLLKEMKLDWLCLPGADKDTQAKLDQRFQKLIST